MSPVYCSSATVSDLDIGSHVRAEAEPSTTPGYFDYIEEQKGLLPDACYRKLIEQLPAVVYMDTIEESDPALYMSHQVEEMLGYTPEEWLYDPNLWSKLLHPEDRNRALSAAFRARSTGEPFTAEYRLIACDGRVVWVRDEAWLFAAPYTAVVAISFSVGLTICALMVGLSDIPMPWLGIGATLVIAIITSLVGTMSVALFGARRVRENAD